MPARHNRHHGRSTARQRLAMLSEATRAFACDGPSLEPAIELVLRRIAAVLGGSARLHLVSADGRVLQGIGSKDAADAPRPLEGTSPEAKAVRSGEPVLAADPRGMVVPLISEGKAIGTIGLHGTAGDGVYSTDDVVFLQAIADTAAVAIGSLRRREQMQQELERAARLKDEFLATLSHELRTPLNAVLGWVHLLRGSTGDPAIFERAVETIERNALTQARLITDLLDMSMIESGRLRLDPVPVDFAATVSEAVESLRSTAEAKSIDLEVVLDPATGQVRGDLPRLRQVAWGLIANAIKFTPRGGRVRASVRPGGSDVVLTVEDNGPGIPAEFLRHVFESFRQADPSPSRLEGGLGLGLALTRHLVELHGGSVGVQNTERGASFTVRLPLMRPRGEDGGLAADVPDVLLKLAGIRVLIVDDDLDVREILGTLLRQRGALVEAVPTATEAFQAVRNRTPHAMVADIGLPDEDGYALIRRIRALPARDAAALPALALTAYARADDRIRALVAGYQMHVPKPVNPVEVGVAVARLLQFSGGAA